MRKERGNRIITTAMVAVISMILAAATTSPAQNGPLTTLFSFDTTDGATPGSALVQGTDGNLYGTTLYGGTYCPPTGCGTLFKIDLTGAETTLHSFSGFGAEPSGLVQASDGNLYGTTYMDGTFGAGTIYRITPSGTFAVLYNFCSQPGCADSGDPLAPLIQASDGNLYGTNSGTAYRISLNGTFSTLCTLDGPTAPLVEGTDGNFYGTTYYGGTQNYGTVFKVTPSGTVTTLYSFCSQSHCTDGRYPWAGLVLGTDGNFYGTTIDGGTAGGSPCFGDCGTVFKVTPSGELTTLHSFHQTDGSYPYPGLVQATDGNFYGTTLEGGSSDTGTIFRITPSGTLTTLYNGCEGNLPIQDTNGNLYGTTPCGGANGVGSVFSLSLGLGRFVETRPTAAKVGASVRILGAGLEGSISVTFNGTAAAFKVVSGSLISTTVPSGATTGPIQVVTPSGALTSNVSFQVLP